LKHLTDSRKKSLVEVLSGKSISFVIGIIANYLILSAFGIESNLELVGTISFVMVSIACVRSYIWRRAFNRIKIFEDKTIILKKEITA